MQYLKIPYEHAWLQHCHIRKAVIWSQWAGFLVFLCFFSVFLDPISVSLPQSEKLQWCREGGDILRAYLHMSLSCVGRVHQHSSLNLFRERIIIVPLFQRMCMECPLWTLQQQARLIGFPWHHFPLWQTC